MKCLEHIETMEQESEVRGAFGNSGLLGTWELLGTCGLLLLPNDIFIHMVTVLCDLNHDPWDQPLPRPVALTDLIALSSTCRQLRCVIFSELDRHALFQLRKYGFRTDEGMLCWPWDHPPLSLPPFFLYAQLARGLQNSNAHPERLQFLACTCCMDEMISCAKSVGLMLLNRAQITGVKLDRISIEKQEGGGVVFKAFRKDRQFSCFPILVREMLFTPPRIWWCTFGKLGEILMSRSWGFYQSPPSIVQFPGNVHSIVACEIFRRQRG